MAHLLGVFGGVRFPHHIGDGITGDEVHHQKDDERDAKQRRDQEQQAPQEIFAHSVPILEAEKHLWSWSPSPPTRVPYTPDRALTADIVVALLESSQARPRGAALVS